MSGGRLDSGVRRNGLLDLEYFGKVFVFVFVFVLVFVLVFVFVLVEPEGSLKLAAANDMHMLHSNTIV